MLCDLWGNRFLSVSLHLLIPQVILKDLEVLAEIASSPAGQTYNSGMCDSSDSKAELHVPEHSNIGHQLVVGEAFMQKFNNVFSFKFVWEQQLWIVCHEVAF